MRHRVEVSPPFFFVSFFSGRSCSARALCECWAHGSKGSTSFQVPSARVTGVDVLCLFYFSTYMCPRFVQYIYTSLLLKWRSISQGPHSNGALFWRDTDLSHPAWQRVHQHHQGAREDDITDDRAWQIVHLPSWQNNSSPSVANSWIRRLRSSFTGQSN